MIDSSANTPNSRPNPASKLPLERPQPSIGFLVRPERHIFPILLVLLLSIFSGCRRGAEVGFAPGNRPPPLDLVTVDGRPLPLEDLKGQVVLLNFWATWCGPCLMELPALQRLYDKLRGKGFAIVAVGVDDEIENLRDFKERYGLTFPIVVDRGGDAKLRYRISGLPESFLLDRKGTLVMLPDPGDDQPVVRIIGPREWDEPNAISRIEAVLAQR